MATKNESATEVLNNKGRPDKKKDLTAFMKRKEKHQDGAGEAGVDPQQEQLNTMPNPHEFPKEPKKKKTKK